MDISVLTPDQIVQQGEQIYSKCIRETLNNEDRGKFIVVDVTNGDYAIAEDDLTASDEMVRRGSRGEMLYGLRVGHPTAYRIGRQAPSA